MDESVAPLARREHDSRRDLTPITSPGDQAASAVFPHVEPTGQLVIGDALLEGEANVYQLDFGPVTLEREGGGPPLELTVSLTLELPTISQPPAPPVPPVTPVAEP